jgi:hypothetical protein
MLKLTVLVATALALSACGGTAPGAPTQNADATTSAASSAATSVPSQGNALPTPEAPTAPVATSAQPTAEVPTPTASPSAQPTLEKLALEIVESQTWTDDHGNARANVVFHNPYDFAVRVNSGSSASLVDSAGKSVESGEFYFLDGVGGGTGAFQADETIAANVCFTCEEALLDEPWADAVFRTSIKPATDPWTYSTDVAATGVKVEYEAGSAIFWVTGKVSNDSSSTLDRISVRILAYVDGTLVGAAEVSAYDVAPGAKTDLSGYGIGENPPGGTADYVISALGVSY